MCAALLGGWWLRASLAPAVVVVFGRLYVGAHLPLDVVGGAALGVVSASVVVLTVGTSTVERAATGRLERRRAMPRESSN
jgi:undecaprenyl-diphosphatase